MLFIRFSEVPDDLIPSFEKIKFDEAVKLTHELEHKYREERKTFAAEFRVIDGNNEILYKGIYDFGSYNYPNIYHQIKKMVDRIKVKKEHEKQKIYLINQLETLTPDNFKKEEDIDLALINLDKSNISKLKRWQRICVYSITCLSIIGLTIVSSAFLIQKLQYERALSESKITIEQNAALIENYENGLLGNSKEFVSYLEGQKKLSDTQKRILAENYIMKDQYDKAVGLIEDTSYVETLILISNQYNIEEKKDKMTEFNNLYPTNEARYDLAYFNLDFELMLNLPTVNMTIERSKMKTYALMKLGKIDEAKAELNNNNNDQLKQAIATYEVLKAEIVTLEEKLKQAELAKDENEINNFKEEIEKKKEEFNAL